MWKFIIFRGSPFDILGGWGGQLFWSRLFSSFCWLHSSQFHFLLLRYVSYFLLLKATRIYFEISHLLPLKYIMANPSEVAIVRKSSQIGYLQKLFTNEWRAVFIGFDYEKHNTHYRGIEKYIPSSLSLEIDSSSMFVSFNTTSLALLMLSAVFGLSKVVGLFFVKVR